jgi:hypothetical protein
MRGRLRSTPLLIRQPPPQRVLFFSGAAICIGDRASTPVVAVAIWWASSLEARLCRFRLLCCRLDAGRGVGFSDRQPDLNRKFADYVTSSYNLDTPNT